MKYTLEGYIMSMNLITNVFNFTDSAETQFL